MVFVVVAVVNVFVTCLLAYFVIVFCFCFLFLVLFYFIFAYLFGWLIDFFFLIRVHVWSCK